MIGIHREWFRGLIGLLLALFAGVVVLAGGTAGTAAQVAGCTLEPIGLPLFDATPASVIVATPASSDDMPEPTEEVILAAAEGIVACTNETSQALRYAVFTERLLAIQFTKDNPAYQPSFERMIATGQATETGTNRLEGISDIEIMDDGRVAVTLHISTPGGTYSDRVVLAWVADQEAWLIDGIVAVQVPATPEG